MLLQSINTVIDQVVTAKKTIVGFVPHKDLQKALTSFVDSQAEYTREAAKAGTDFVSAVGDIAMDRTPYINATKQFAGFFPDFAKAASKKKA